MPRAVRLDQARSPRLSELKARRDIVALARKRRPKRRIKILQQKHPRGEAVRYRSALLALVRELAEEIKQQTTSTIVRLAEQTRAADPSVRTDAPADEVGDMFERLRETVFTPDLRNRIRSTSGQMVKGVVGFNRRELNRVFESAIGVGLPDLEPYLDDALSAAARENARRITNLLEDQLSQVEEQVLSGFRKGLRHTEIAKNIANQVEKTANRARLIARDQVASLNGELTRKRQTALGVEKYTWRDSNDDRVRPEHEEFDGNVYTWEKGSPNGTHPGEEILCRCIAEPFLDDILAETGQIAA